MSMFSCVWVGMRASDGRERLHVSVFIGMLVDGTVGGGRIARFSIVDFRHCSILQSGREGVKTAFADGFQVYFSL